MIHYQLQCQAGHSFDGWFKNSTSFDRQAVAGLVTCPICDSAKVSRALMAPALGRGSRNAPPDHRPDQPDPVRIADDPSDHAQVAAKARSGATPTAALPANLRSLLQRLRAEIEKTCDYVGSEFAEEARKIHYGERETRGIFGEATRDEAEALADEGIAFGVLPWLPRADS